ncbi:MAG: hypothetical protein ACI9HY_000030 [Planctomycetaceae bacterium]|jgi:hypothetical protein
MKRLRAIEDSDLMLINKGNLVGTDGGTNAIKIVEVGKMENLSSNNPTTNALI